MLYLLKKKDEKKILLRRVRLKIRVNMYPSKNHQNIRIYKSVHRSQSDEFEIGN